MTLIRRIGRDHSVSSSRAGNSSSVPSMASGPVCSGISPGAGPGGPTTVRTIYLDTDGDFVLTPVEPGTYDLAFKASHWLQDVIPGSASTLQDGGSGHDLGQAPCDEVLYLLSLVVQDAVDAEIEVGVVELEQIAKEDLKPLQIVHGRTPFDSVTYYTIHAKPSKGMATAHTRQPQRIDIRALGD